MSTAVKDRLAFWQTLSSAFGEQMKPMIDALDQAKAALAGTPFEEVAESLAEQVRSGSAMWEAMGQHAAATPTLINGLVGIAAQAMGDLAIRDCLDRHALSVDALEWLAAELARPNASAPDRGRWIVGERAMALQVTRLSLDQAQALAGRPRAPDRGEAAQAFLRSRAFRILWPDRALRKDFDKYYDQVGELSRKPTWEVAAAAREAPGDPFEQGSVKEWNILARMLLPAVGRAHQRYIRAICDRRALRINVALRRYRLKRGRYPRRLAQLAPGLLAKIPLDPFSGKDFIYRLRRNFWSFHSVGPDGDDDGGRGGRNYEKDGDILYRTAARRRRK